MIAKQKSNFIEFYRLCSRQKNTLKKAFKIIERVNTRYILNGDQLKNKNPLSP